VLKLLDTGANEPLTEDASDDDLAILEAYVRQRQAPAPDDDRSKDSPETDGEGPDETEGGT
jgi:cytochrome c553